MPFLKSFDGNRTISSVFFHFQRLLLLSKTSSYSVLGGAVCSDVHWFFVDPSSDNIFLHLRPQWHPHASPTERKSTEPKMKELMEEATLMITTSRLLLAAAVDGIPIATTRHAQCVCTCAP